MIEAGQRFDAWAVVRATDTLGRRALVACVCGRVIEVATTALQSGESRGCGCRGTPRARTTTDRPASDAFSRDLARIERFASTGRHHGRGREQ